jgi:hypothetical protein
MGLAIMQLNRYKVFKELEQGFTIIYNLQRKG